MTNNAIKFDMDAQLEQIEAFTQQQQLAMQDIINSAHEAFPTVDPETAVEKVEQEVSDLLGSLEEQIKQEMTKINQQLEVLLPTDNQ